MVQTQVLPYLRDLARAGLAVHLLTFETKPLGRDLRDRWSLDLQSHGITWTSRAYHKRPAIAATLFDIVAGSLHVARHARRHGVDVLHARAHIPLAMSLLARSAARVRIVFDLRGLMAEEYVDGGVWREGSWIVGLVKRFERYGLRVADQVVVLTERMRERLVAQGIVSPERLEVIPCCTDLTLYPRASEWAYSIAAPSSRLELVYAGSVDGLYELEEMARFFVALMREVPSATFRILTNGRLEATQQRLERAGIPASVVTVSTAPSRDVPAILSRSHVGISFRKATESQIAASPTKIGEYLAAGLPVVSNAGIGDIDRILAEDRVGVVVNDYSTESLAAAIKRLLGMLGEPGLRARCQASARKTFGLEEVASGRYRRLYARLAVMARHEI